MDKFEILGMKSGRDMDDLIARRIFGFKTYKSGGGELFIGKQAPSDCPALVVPFYSTHITDVWGILAILNGYNWELSNGGNMGYCFKIYKGGTTYEAEAITIPLVVCRAALLTTLSEKEIKPNTWKRGYKVVLKGKKIHYSATYLGSFAPKHLRERFKYRIGMVTKRRKGWGPMAVFTDLDEALRFSERIMEGYSAVFKCQYIPSTTRRLFTDKNKMMAYFPDNTDFADEVILAREVKTI